MVSTDLVRLAAGPLELLLNPAVGGSIARFDFAGHDRRTPILRGDDAMGGDVLAAGCFPLVPFVNRIRGGRFDFRGRTVTLSRNMAGDVSPLHGQGWLSPWEVVSADDATAHLRFDHAAGDWPWDYVADQHFTLAETRLDVTLTCTNRSADPMPCGLGQHPFFCCTATTRIATRVSDVWTIDANVLPVEKMPATGAYDLSDRAVCGLGLDHGFGGWEGTAMLSEPAWPFTIAMTSPDATFFQLYSPATGGIFVAEPVTHANAALNAPEEQWPQLGMRVLGPGENMALTMRLELS